MPLPERDGAQNCAGMGRFWITPSTISWANHWSWVCGRNDPAGTKAQSCSKAAKAPQHEADPKITAAIPPHHRHSEIRNAVIEWKAINARS